MNNWKTFIAAAMLALCQLPAMAQAPFQAAQTIDPPGRVARLNLIEGPVSFSPAPSGNESDSSAWSQAQRNRPLTAGDRLWTDRRARSELQIGSTTVRMNEQTSLDFLALDDNTTQLRLAQGTARLRVRTLYSGQHLEVDTPNLAFVISQPGDYRLDVNTATNTTRVVSQSGAGVIYGDSGTPVNLGARQQITFADTNLAPAGLGSTSLDAFDQWAIARDQSEDRSVTARYVPRETVGYQQLDNYGDWTQDPGYGAVWLPRAVPADWAPYRLGHWDFIRPWGWTWIDDAPWGFAPFHYGRWAQIGPRWGWVPGRLAQRPVYAPALVAFVGGGSGGVSWNLSIGGGTRPALGWFPLAPGEAFRPAYQTSTRYVTQINHNIVVSNIVNQTNVTNVYRYALTPAAVTAVSTADFARGQPVAINAALTAADLRRARLVESDRGIPQRTDTREARVAGPVPNPRSPDADNPLRAPARGGAATPLSTAPAQTAATIASPASPPAIQPDKSAQTARRHTRFEQERQQHDAQRTAVTAQPLEESIGQRALREQAQRNAAMTTAKPGTRPDTRPDTRPEASPAAYRSADYSIEQARRAQQQLQREQQHQQRDLVRQQDQQRSQSEESLGQRAQRERAEAQQRSQQPSQERQKERANNQREAGDAHKASEQQKRQHNTAPEK